MRAVIQYNHNYDAGASGCAGLSRSTRCFLPAPAERVPSLILINGYLVLQENIPSRTSQIKHILKLLGKKNTSYPLG